MNTFGLLGKNIGYSFSKGYFTEKFKNENISAQYVNFDIQNINEVREVLKTEELKGFNITIPYKQEIFPFLSKLDPVAKEIGAVNVVKVAPDGNLTGHNSDYYGFKESLQPLLHKKIKKALILGTGGASKAIAYALTSLQITYTYVSRNPGQNQIAYTDLTEELINQHHLLINCTPLGTFPNITDCPDIPYQFIGKQHILYDLIYNPETTTFMQKGIDQGATVSNGLQMLILQAEKSWDIWEQA
ncbi:shikimate dehydrogenase [Aquimarina sp. ERC-38]|uniref:shikimate dehydrogenase family protein n=1 Tax=Aquimarina sp. ERC-38 TaxID=2949996 RepID=UPI0022462165|nr:shikimate dehydrogenase [Aquimarina sp. ERC-38]UZO80464.1 shikimate dehydrogenase [Aquimarina sp. ERC-38]